MICADAFRFFSLIHINIETPDFMSNQPEKEVFFVKKKKKKAQTPKEKNADIGDIHRPVVRQNHQVPHPRPRDNNNVIARIETEY